MIIGGSGLIGSKLVTRLRGQGHQAVPIHRHDAHGFIYVLEGSVVMQVKGGKPVTLTGGQTFYEGPEDVHTVGRNASGTRPAKLLAVLLKNKGAPALVPVNE